MLIAPVMMADMLWPPLVIAVAGLGAALLAGTLAGWARVHRQRDVAWIVKLDGLFWSWPAWSGLLSWALFTKVPGLWWRATIAAIGMCAGGVLLVFSRGQKPTHRSWRGRPLAAQLRVAGLALVAGCAAGAALTAILAAMSTSSDLR